MSSKPKPGKGKGNSTVPDESDVSLPASNSLKRVFDEAELGASEVKRSRPEMSEITTPLETQTTPQKKKSSLMACFEAMETPSPSRASGPPVELVVKQEEIFFSMEDGTRVLIAIMWTNCFSVKNKIAEAATKEDLKADFWQPNDRLQVFTRQRVEPLPAKLCQSEPLWIVNVMSINDEELKVQSEALTRVGAAVLAELEGLFTTLGKKTYQVTVQREQNQAGQGMLMGLLALLKARQRMGKSSLIANAVDDCVPL